MPLFYYEAINEKKKIVKGKIEHEDRSDVIKTLVSQKLRPIKITETKPNSLTSMNISFGGKKIKNSDLVIMTRQLSVMVGAGVPLIRSLNSLAFSIKYPNLNNGGYISIVFSFIKFML